MLTREVLPSLVFLLDVDNTLLDNDRFAIDLGAKLASSFGVPQRDRYWKLFDELRGQTGYADYLAALQLFREGLDAQAKLFDLSSYLLEYDFTKRLYPNALATVTHLRSLGRAVMLSDGDIVFQPRKIKRAGLFEAVDGEVMIYIHKQHELQNIQQRYPSTHYVMVDDKPNILADMKCVLGNRLTTVFVQQGHYASAASAALSPAPDIEIEQIGDLRRYGFNDFMHGATQEIATISHSE